MDAQTLWSQGALPLLAGTALGFLYFAGLWWTSRRVAQVGARGPFLFGSFVVRVILFLAGLWLVTGGRLVPTALFMVGFVISRRIMLARALPRGGRGTDGGTDGGGDGLDRPAARSAVPGSAGTGAMAGMPGEAAPGSGAEGR